MSDKSFNRVVLNIGATGVNSPEPDIAAVMIDGTPIHGVSFIQVRAAANEFTTIQLIFTGEVGGFVANQSVGDILRNADK